MRWSRETELAAKHDGWTVVKTDGEVDYQGWGVHLLKRGDHWAVLAWSYGSCSGCDQYEDLLSYEEMGETSACHRVFGDLIEVCNSEEAARLKFSERKGW